MGGSGALETSASAASLGQSHGTTLRSSASVNSMGGASFLASLDGTRSTKSMCGAQVSSHKPSAASFSFGSAPARLTFTGAAARGPQVLQASVASGDESPGPIYNPAPSSKWLGDAPHSHFGTSEQRPPSGAAGADISKLTGKSLTPGPGSYVQPGSVGKQPLGRCHSDPAFSFGTMKQRESAAKATPSPGPVYEPRGTRMGSMVRSAYSFGNEIRLKNREGGLRTPGPGNYNSRSSSGTQFSSSFRTAPQACFGQPSLAGSSRGMLPLEGRASPGPIYMGAAAIRNQSLSGRRSMPRTAFTRAQRFPAGVNSAASGPGPGEYVI